MRLLKSIKNQPPLYSVALYDYGNTPVSTTVSVAASSTGFDIHIWADEFIDPAKIISSHSKEFDWKDFAHALMALEEGFIGDDAIDQVKVLGIGGLRAECLKYAWASEDCGNHGYYRELLDWLLLLEEDTIDFLENNYDLSITGKDLDIFIELKDYILDRNISDFLLFLKENQLIGDMTSIQKIIDVCSIENKNKAVREKERRILALEPYVDKIRLLAEKYSNYQTRSAYAPPSDRRILSEWLEYYVIEHGEMPTGVHNVEKVTYGGRRLAGPGKINFDDIGKGDKL